MSCLCLSLIIIFRAGWHLIFVLSESCFSDVVPKLTWEPIVSRTRVFVVLGYRLSRSNRKLSSQAVFHLWNCVFSWGWEVNVWSVVWSRSWHLCCLNMRPSTNFAEVPHTTIFVFRQKVVAFFIYTKGYGIGSWSWNS